MDKMYKGLKINVWKLPCGDKKYAGGYKLQVVEMYGVKMELELGAGEPFECAFKDAERLAVAIDAELNINNVTVRKSTKAEYKE